jgi:WD repeat-containing protein 26
LIAADPHNIHVYDFQTREKKFALSFNASPICITISHDSRYMLIGFSSGEIHLIYITGRRLIRRFRGLKVDGSMIRCTFLGTDEKLVMSGCEDSRIYIWDRDSGRLLDILEGHIAGCVNSVSFNNANPDIFASAGDDGTVRIWRRTQFPDDKMHTNPQLTYMGKAFSLKYHPLFSALGMHGESMGNINNDNDDAID